LKVVLERDVDPAGWNSLVAADPDASFFHDPVWIQSLARVYTSFRPLYFLARDDSGRLLGGLPAVRSSRAGLTQLLSLPFGSYGTPLVAPGSAAQAGQVRAALLDRWFAEARRPGVVRAHLTPFQAEAPNPVHLRFPPSWRRNERTHLIPLREGFEAIWFHRYDKENRTASRKAVKLGVIVAREPGEPGARIIEELYRRQHPEWTGHIPYRYGLFRSLVETCGDRVEVWVARQADRPVFAVMTFYHRDTVMPWLSGNTADARALCAGNLVHKVMIEDAASRGFATYNFGGSGGVPGIEAFKVAFGGIPVDYTSYFKESPWFGRVRKLSHRFRRPG
jgi:CelD/BcsL family acetyltransferase involved in cellulose biosynthesis